MSKKPPDSDLNQLQKRSKASRYRSIQQQAAKWGVSDSTVRRMIEAGELPALKIGKTFKIHVLDIEIYEQTNRTIPAT